MFARTRRRRTAAVGAGICLSLLGLSSCAIDKTSRPTETAEASNASNIFDSDAAAIASADAAYAAYLRTSDLILSEGGAEPERIEPFVSGHALEVAMADFEDFRTAGVRLVGSTGFRIDGLQNRRLDGGDELVTVYICSDVSNVDIVDGDGVSRVAAGRDTSTPFAVTVTASSVDESKVSEKLVWTGTDFC